MPEPHGLHRGCHQAGGPWDRIPAKPLGDEKCLSAPLPLPKGLLPWEPAAGALFLSFFWYLSLVSLGFSENLVLRLAFGVAARSGYVLWGCANYWPLLFSLPFLPILTLLSSLNSSLWRFSRYITVGAARCSALHLSQDPRTSLQAGRLFLRGATPRGNTGESLELVGATERGLLDDVASSRARRPRGGIGTLRD